MSDQDDAGTDAPKDETTTAEPAEPAEPAAERDPAEVEEIRRGRVELMAAILLGLAGALTAFSAYKAALTDGDALAGYTESTKATSDANSYYDDYSQQYFADKQLFFQYHLQRIEDEETGADIALGLRELYFSPELEEATLAWEVIPAEESPATPLDMEDEYVLQSYTDYETSLEEADAKFEEGATADAAGDEFELANVYFAVALFMAGVAALFRRHPVRYFALGLSVLGIVPGVIAMLNGQSALG